VVAVDLDALLPAKIPCVICGRKVTGLMYSIPRRNEVCRSCIRKMWDDAGKNKADLLFGDFDETHDRGRSR